jgi:hypothetical protein
MIHQILQTVRISSLGVPMNLTTVPSTKVNGPKKDSDMERVFRSGRTDRNMKVTGKMIWLTEKAD